ncbi:MAG: polysaccharide deacetylase family protein, partial [Xanthomonadales bacterium]|nr:polysaccharide deacetylase family protein [Xanthomonadales bacterium]
MTIRSISFFAILISGLLYVQTVMAANSAVVFMYHRFGEDKHPTTSIRLEQFRQQLEYLREDGFNVIPLPDLMAFLTRKQSLPEKAVVITMDDAYRSIYQVAYPLLKEYGYPFTVFVSSDPVDRGLPDYLSWEQIREMAKTGVKFANHGAEHTYLVRRLNDESESDWLQRAGADIDKGWQRLTEELPGDNKPLGGVFAYPYGEYDTKIADLLKQRSYLAFGQHSGAIG